jgi:hypothetical protein
MLRFWLLASATLALAQSGLSGSPLPIHGWSHDWASGSSMTFTDFGYSLLTDAQAAFAASKYKVISLEKCTGRGQGVTSEKAIYQTARQLKKFNPALKVIFYWHSGGAGFGCYAANKEYVRPSYAWIIADPLFSNRYMSHPEWWLKDDTGAIVGGASTPKLDWSNQAARDWWVSIPLKGDGNGTVPTFEGQPLSELIDGVLADGAGYAKISKISQARLETLDGESDTETRRPRRESTRITVSTRVSSCLQTPTAR